MTFLNSIKHTSINMDHIKNIFYLQNFFLIILILWFSFLSCSSQNIKYEINEKGIKINATIHSRFIPKDSIIQKSIQIIDVSVKHSHKPYRRLWGIGQPRIKTDRIELDKYREGWFMLNNDDIALVFMGEHNKAIYIRTTMPPPKHVKLISKIEPVESPEKRKTFTLLLGTSNPFEMKEKLIYEWVK